MRKCVDLLSKADVYVQVVINWLVMLSALEAHTDPFTYTHIGLRIQKDRQPASPMLCRNR